MTHPLVPQIMDIAVPIAESLALEVVNIVLESNRRPPVLRLELRHKSRDIGLDDCEKMSRALEEALDTQEIIPDAYVLEVSSPGIASKLSSDRDFESFKGFDVVVRTEPPYKDRHEWRGRLQGRDDQAVLINQKGRMVSIPRELVTEVEFDDG